MTIDKNTICAGTIEELKPRLAAGTEILPFTAKIALVRRASDGLIVKIAAEEAPIVKMMDGSRSLADILHHELLAGSTGRFAGIFDLLFRLNDAKVLDDVCSVKLKNLGQAYTTAKKNERVFIPLSAGIIDNALGRIKGHLLSSYPLLGLMLIFAVYALFFMPIYRGINIMTALFNGEAATPVVTYGAAIIFIWFSISLILSIRGLGSACITAAHGIKPAGLRVTAAHGFIYIDHHAISIAAAGPVPAVKLYVFRMLVPLTLAGIAAACWKYAIPALPLALFHHAAVCTGFVVISPLLASDFNRLIALFRTGSHHTSSFLRRRFFLELFSLKKHTKEQEFYLALSLLGLVWLYWFYSFIWDIIKVTLTHMLSDLIGADIAGQLVIAAAILMILLPFAALLAGIISILITNLQQVAATPLSRLTRLSREISAQRAPAVETVKQFLREIPLFSKLDDTELTELCSNLTVARFGKGRNIITQGESGNTFSTIVAGKALVLVSDAAGREKTLETLGPGDSFGETALIEEVPRTATVRTLEPVVLFTLERSWFEKFVVASAGGKQSVTDMIRLGKLILHIPLLSFLTPRQMHALAGKLVEKDYDAGTAVFREGDTGDTFYIIREGSVKIERTVQGNKETVVVFEPGGWFGEIALIKDVPRTASAIAQTKVKLLTLAKDDFHALVQNSIFTGIELDAVLAHRTEQLGKEALKSCSLS